MSYEFKILNLKVLQNDHKNLGKGDYNHKPVIDTSSGAINKIIRFQYMSSLLF